MAKTTDPVDWFPGWTYDGGTDTFSITEASLGLTAGDAHATTGDIRKCLAAILARAQAFHDATTSADKLTTMVPTFGASGQNLNYTVTFSGNPATFTHATEP